MCLLWSGSGFVPRPHHLLGLVAAVAAGAALAAAAAAAAAGQRLRRRRLAFADGRREARRVVLALRLLRSIATAGRVASGFA
jgi:hypothetical protein